MVNFSTYTFTLPTKHRKTQYTLAFTLSLYQPNTVKHNIFSLLQFIFSILILRLTTCDVLQRNKQALNEVLHISDIRKSLISRSILTKKGFRMVFESNKFLLIKGGVYVSKSYLVDSLFKVYVGVVDKKSMYLYLKLINK